MAGGRRPRQGGLRLRGFQKARVDCYAVARAEAGDCAEGTGSRSYKRAAPIDRALAIIEAEVKAGKLDGSLFEIFVKSETHGVVL